MNLREIPWLRWFATGLDDLIYREAKKHPFFIPWFREIVEQACDRIEAKIEAETPPCEPLPQRDNPDPGRDYRGGK